MESFREGEEGIEEPEGSGIPEEHGRPNQVMGTHRGLAEAREPIGSDLGPLHMF